MTNNTAEPVDWNVTFVPPESGEIYTSWSVGFCVNRGPAGGSPQTPCDGICSNPISFSGPHHQGHNLGMGAVCYETMAALSGGNCGNFTGGRTFSVIGQQIS